jgi:circadian clock protein KaiB
MTDPTFVYGPDAGFPANGGDPDAASAHLDDLLGRMLELTGEPRGRVRTGPPPVPGREAGTRGGGGVRPRIDLVLYTSAASERSQRAVRAVRHVLDEYVAAQVKFETCDLSVRPQDGEADSVVFTPTLVKQGPGPRTSIIGNLDHEEILRELLDASGVERLRYDD